MKNSEIVNFLSVGSLFLSKAISPWIIALMKIITMLAFKMAAFKFEFETILAKIEGSCNV